MTSTQTDSKPADASSTPAQTAVWQAEYDRCASLGAPEANCRLLADIAEDSAARGASA